MTRAAYGLQVRVAGIVSGAINMINLAGRACAAVEA